MKMIEAVRRPAVSVGPEQTVHRAASVMDESGVGAVVVIDAGRVTGIVTEIWSGGRWPGASRPMRGSMR